MTIKLWSTYRLKRDATYDQRYEALVKAFNAIGEYLWTEPTSFCAFETEFTIDQAALRVKAAVNEYTDLVLIREVGVKDARYIGTPEYPVTFASYFPEAKKV